MCVIITPGEGSPMEERLQKILAKRGMVPGVPVKNSSLKAGHCQRADRHPGDESRPTGRQNRTGQQGS